MTQKLTEAKKRWAKNYCGFSIDEPSPPIAKVAGLKVGTGPGDPDKECAAKVRKAYVEQRDITL